MEKPTIGNTGEETTTNESKPRKPRAKGFAFVWFFSKKDAERAITGVNGRAVRAGAVGAPTMNKKERARLRRQLRQNKGEDADADDGEGEEKETGERIVAVDWALSKEKWEEAKAKDLAGEGEAVDADSDETSGSDGTGLDSESEEDSEDDSESLNEDIIGDDESADEDKEVDGDDDDFEDEARSDAEEARKPLLPQTDVGTTLFIRNLPFDAAEDELRTLYVIINPRRECNSDILHTMQYNIYIASAHSDLYAMHVSPSTLKVVGREVQASFVSGTNPMPTKPSNNPNYSRARPGSLVVTMATTPRRRRKRTHSLSRPFSPQTPLRHSHSPLYCTDARSRSHGR